MRSHHSHSGDYILHAKDRLDDIIEAAIAKGFTSYCLTEHIPRNSVLDLYPEEAQLQLSDLESNFDKFYRHARVAQKKYADRIALLVGFETDFIRPDYAGLIKSIQARYSFDMFVGSVHHVLEIPIDFDEVRWQEAMAKCGGTPDLLFERYFDEQYAMLTELNPPVVGHFDLIRLFAGRDTDTPVADWPRVLVKVERNIDFVISYGGLFELNSAAIRKGWLEPYPRADICQIILQKGGKFCFSDDSHGIAQVGLNYHKLLKQAEGLGIKEVSYVDLQGGKPVVKSESIEDIKKDQFWAQYDPI